MIGREFLAPLFLLESGSIHPTQAKLNTCFSNEVTADATLDSTRVFERYYRSESAKQHSGAGLGLWLSQSMAHELGSNIKLTTGTQFVRFEFSIPV